MEVEVEGEWGVGVKGREGSVSTVRQVIAGRRRGEEGGCGCGCG